MKKSKMKAIKNLEAFENNLKNADFFIERWKHYLKKSLEKK